MFGVTGDRDKSIKIFIINVWIMINYTLNIVEKNLIYNFIKAIQHLIKVFTILFLFDLSLTHHFGI